MVRREPQAFSLRLSFFSIIMGIIRGWLFQPTTFATLAVAGSSANPTILHVAIGVNLTGGAACAAAADATAIGADFAAWGWWCVSLWLFHDFSAFVSGQAVAGP